MTANERGMPMRTFAECQGGRRAGAIVAGCLLVSLLAFAFSSCRLLSRHGLSQPDSWEGSAEADVLISARFLRDSHDAPGSFLTLLPDSGIVPVRVALRNNGSRPLVIFSANGMRLDSGFEGFILTADGNRYVPVHPKAVLERLLGARKARRYRSPGAFNVFLGTILVPLGGYYLYNEVDIGRYRRPLFSRSFFPALESGIFRPVVIEPGAEKSGYLYFDVGPGAVSDSIGETDSRGRPRTVRVPFAGKRCTLFVQPCAPREANGALSGTDFRLADEYLFAIGGSGRTMGLFFAPVQIDAQRQLGSLERLAPVLSKSATIADISVRGDTATIGLNFKAKSKVCFAVLGEVPRLFGERYFPRNIKRVLRSGADAFVVTDDGFCHALSIREARRISYASLGSEVVDAIATGDRLFAFQRTRGLNVFGSSRGETLKLLERRHLHGGSRRVVGFLDDKLIVLNRGRAAAGDTLAIFIRESMYEIRRVTVPGHIVQASCGESAVILQLEDGTALKLVPAPLASLKIAEAAYLPFKARALACGRSGFIAIGDSGAYAAGSLGDYAPGIRGMLDISVAVH